MALRRRCHEVVRYTILDVFSIISNNDIFIILFIHNMYIRSNVAEAAAIATAGDP